MSTITVGIYDDHKIIQQSLCAFLSSNEDFEALPIMQSEKLQLIEELKGKGINVLIINIHTLNTAILNLITQLNLSYPRARILVVSHTNSEEIILKTIKAGAKGFLDKEANISDFSEAIYTLRNGHDYYSKSIAHLLLNKYIKKMSSREKLNEPTIHGLSARQIEILQLWGNNYSNKEIADKLFISVRTVESHKNHIMQRLDLKTTIDMIKFGIKNNLIEI